MNVGAIGELNRTSGVHLHGLRDHHRRREFSRLRTDAELG
jgi:hypothetical protein